MGTLFCTGSQGWKQRVPVPAQLVTLAAASKRLVSAGGNRRRRDGDGGLLWVHERHSGQRSCEIALFDEAAVHSGQPCKFRSLIDLVSPPRAIVHFLQGDQIGI